MRRVFLISSKQCYKDLEEIAKSLIKLDYEIVYPNCMDNFNLEDNYRENEFEHSRWKKEMFQESIAKIKYSDMLLVVNNNIEGRIPHYIGGATLLEMYEGFRQNKPVYVLNELPDCPYRDELIGVTTRVINGDFSQMTKSKYFESDNKLLSFLNKSYPWDNKRDLTVSKELIEKGRDLLDYFYFEPEIYPLVDKGLQFEWESDTDIVDKYKYYIEFCIYENNICSCLIQYYNKDICVIEESTDILGCIKGVNTYLTNFHKIDS